MAGLFITSSGTGIGKTFVATGLVRHLREAGRTVDAIKPVISGFDPNSAEQSDTGLLLAALGQPVTPAGIERISPWRLTAPLSPDMAAEQEGHPIDFDRLVGFCKDALSKTNNLLIEGAGGVMAPITHDHTMLDLISALQIPVLLVVGNYLGAISHTLSAESALRQRGCAPRMIVVSESEGASVNLDDTAGSISRFARNVGIVAMPRASDPASREGAFGFIAENCGLA